MENQTPIDFTRASLPGAAITCLNSLTHGGTSKSLFIPGEDPEEFYDLLKDIFEEFQPGTAHAAGIATDAATARWFVWRRQRAFSITETELYTNKPHPSDWDSTDFQRLNLLDRYKTQAERALRRAFINVEALRRQTRREMHWQAAYELSKQRVALQEERFRYAQQKKAEKADKKVDEKKIEQEFLGLDKLDDKPAVTQQVTLTVDPESGQTEVAFNPSNDDVLQQYALSQDDQNPPQIIIRDIAVVGPLTEELSWVRTAAKITYPDLKGRSLVLHFVHHIDPEAFENLAIEEAVFNHTEVKQAA